MLIHLTIWADFNLSPKTPFSHKDAAYDARRVELAHQAQKMIKTSSREFPRSRSSTEEDVWNSELRGINDEEPTPDSEDSEDPFVELNTTLGAFEVLFEPQTPITRNNWERYFDEYVPEHAQDWGLSEPESRLSGVLIKDRDWIQKRVFWRVSGSNIAFALLEFKRITIMTGTGHFY